MVADRSEEDTTVQTDGIEFVAETRLPTSHGVFRVRAYRDLLTGTEPLAIVSGEVEGRERIAVRVHDECLTSEVLGSLKCDCKLQLDHALAYVRDHDGVVIYLRQEGRGIGLANKIAAYALQEQGLDTVDANRALGLPDDARRYHAAAAILADLSLDHVRLMTNNPRKIERLGAEGIDVVERIPVVGGSNPHSHGYLEAKVERMGHHPDLLRH
ncbi:MAG: GTP cyclohydrolase II [Alphaproteobacteria bacterium]|nr:GTP cyclohydrolase II [Alphaproteobacteria bacterium]